MGLTGIGAVAAIVLSLPVAHGPGSEPLYGRVTTDEGRVVEGWLRWDRNEASFGDYLDALVAIRPDDVREAERLDPEFAAEQRAARSLVAFGTRITWDEDDQADPPTTRAALRFAHLAAIERVDARNAVAELRDGTRIELRSGSTDLGRGMRELEVLDREGEDHSFRWSEIERVDFFPGPAGGAGFGARLHGTVTTWADETFTGDIAWDLDEVLESDILDGRARGDDRDAFPFSEIAAIEWDSERSARVLLRSGETLVVRGTNDVNRENRGIEVSDPSFGRAIVHWEDFRSVRFHEPASRAPAEPAFAPGDTLRAVVHASDGRALEGAVRWNNVRSRLWDSLRGWSGDTEIAVELGSIALIRKVSDDAVEVTTRGGRVFRIEVEAEDGVGNRAVFVTPEGRATRIVLWRALDRVEVAR